MKKFYYIGILFWLAFEVANVYFISPIPGSQEINSIELAYCLHAGRWLFRAAAGLLVLLGIRNAWEGKRWLLFTATTIVIALVAVINLKMSADRMFLQPGNLVMANAGQSNVSSDKVVLGIEYKGEARAYPIQLIAYHHQVVDTIAGKTFMITYCSVCRSGRVFEPLVNGKEEKFRLVGMDHFNAMFEDQSTGTWWRQVTGEAVAGSQKGQFLPEWPCQQTSMGTWLRLHPNSLVMQPDPAFAAEYAGLSDYERGKSKGSLTATDTVAWSPKSWVIGIVVDGKATAYNWMDLQRKRIIQDTVGGTPVLLVLADDDQSFFAFRRPITINNIEIAQDSLVLDSLKYALDGASARKGEKLIRIQAYQEFWHSWKTFQPNTTQYGGKLHP